jgi:hypothetical protein
MDEIAYLILAFFMILLTINDNETKWRLSIRRTVCFRPIVDELN